MTARDEAIQAIDDAGLNGEIAGVFLDVIPPDVLARLAIEQGALQRYVVPCADPDTPPLYAVVEP